MQHKHHDLIVAWAKGAAIQYNDKDDGFWYDTTNPSWCNHVIYRIKPEPKPDVIRSYAVSLSKGNRTALWHQGEETLMLIFDGETGKLKGAQVLASSAE